MVKRKTKKTKNLELRTKNKNKNKKKRRGSSVFLRLKSHKKAFHKKVKSISRHYKGHYLKHKRNLKKKINKITKGFRLIPTPEGVEVKLKKLSPFKKYLKRFAFTFLTMTVFSGLIIYWYALRDLPSPYMLTIVESPQTTIIRDRNGLVLYKIYNNANRIKLTWEEIPEMVKNATVAIEDANFYRHRGISLKAIVRAFLYNLSQNQMQLYQGGSTITQQLVKNRLVGFEKTYKRKLREIVLALWTEFSFSKKDILTMYLNEVGYGGPAYGIEAASQMYFGKSAKNLTLGEAAFLAGLPAAPTTFSPFGANSHLSEIREHQVLDRMFKLKMISEKEYKKAINEKLVFAPQKTDILAPHFVMFVKNQLVEKLGEKLVEEGGLDVYTTLDFDIQKKAEEIVRKNIETIQNKYNIHNAGVLITAPSTGEILAMVGSKDYFDLANKGYVNVTTALRQPGSAIKPVNYAYAFDHNYTPTSVIVDTPVVYTAKGSKEVYKPRNYDGKFHGVVTLRSALANSYNVPAVRLLNSYGVNKMIEQGKKMGIRSWNNIGPIGLSLTLGGAEVSMLDMARAYGTLANLGTRKELKVIKQIHDNNGIDVTTLFYSQNKDLGLVGSVQAQDSQQVVSPLSAYWLTDILADNRARLPAFGLYAKLTIPNHKVAVKTGTSNEFRDNWTIGFTPDYLVAVWVGNNDGTPMNKYLVSGITGAAPIWNETMSVLLTNTPPKEFPVPKGLIPVKICAVNGLLTCPNCPEEKMEYFTADKIPTKKCFFRPKAECDALRQQTEAEGKSEEEKKQLLSGCL